MKKNEKVVLTALQAMLRLKFDELQNQFGHMSLEECARALLQVRVLQLHNPTELSEDGSQVDVAVCTNFAGEFLTSTVWTS